MVKTVTDKPGQIGSGSEANKFSHIHGVTTKPGQRNTDTTKYTGVRKRKWGKWVSEIRLPNSRERIWLGSYSSARRAARAFDAALFCLRGPTAKFNFPDNPPEIPGGRSFTPSQIQSAAAQFANSEPQIENSDPSTSSSSGTDELNLVDSPSNSVSDGAIHFNNDFALDTSFLDEFETMGTSSGNNSVPDFGIFPGFDDFATDFFMSPPLPNAVDYNEVEETYDDYTSQGSFLWNF